MGKTKKIKKVSWKTEEERKMILNQVMREINKKSDSDVIHYAKEEKEWEKIPTGIPEIDKIIGGFPFGHFSVLWGSPATGKTTIMYCLIAEAQKRNKIVCYLDLENSFNAERAKQFGIKLEELMITKFPQAEKSLDAIIELAKKKIVDVIILDSLHGLSPIREQEEKSGAARGLEEDEIALLARKLSKFFRVATSPIERGNVAVILIGQTRTSVGFIAIEQLTGGNALKHNSVLILRIRRGQKNDAPIKKIKKTIVNNEGFKEKKIITERIGFDTTIEIRKTQTPNTSPEGTKIHIPFYYQTGFIKLNKK